MRPCVKALTEKGEACMEEAALELMEGMGEGYANSEASRSADIDMNHIILRASAASMAGGSLRTNTYTTLNRRTESTRM